MATDAYQALIDSGFTPDQAGRIVRLSAQRKEEKVSTGEGFTAVEMQRWGSATEMELGVEAARIDWYASDAVPLWAKRWLDAREL